MKVLDGEVFDVLGTPVSALSMDVARDRVCGWISRRDRCRLVTFTNVHMIVEGLKSDTFGSILRSADLNCPDGMPLVWLGNWRAAKRTSRVCGPEFMSLFCEETAALGLRHFFYGSDAETVQKMIAALKSRSPGIQIAGFHSPPFRPLTADEDKAVVAAINEASPDLVWVCLGCPKQENWMHAHRTLLNASVLLAVGMAFHTIAGTAKRAPRIFRITGMEWLYRLYHDPIRLWRRYLVSNSVFLYRLLLESINSITMLPSCRPYVGSQERVVLSSTEPAGIDSESQLRHIAAAVALQKQDLREK